MPKSNCCNSKVKVEGRTTLCYVCLKCGEACDVHSNQRKTWTRNPKEQITPNKKKDWNKLTRNEIKNFLKMEDY